MNDDIMVREEMSKVLQRIRDALEVNQGVVQL
jgi:hypothetical protein